MAGGQRPPGTQGGASGPGPDRTTTDESTRTSDSARTPSMKRGPQPTGTTPEPPKPQAPNPPTPEQGSHSNTTSGPATTRKGNPSAQEAQQTSGNAGRANATCEPDGPQGHGEGTSGQGSQGGGSRSRDPSAEWQQAGRRSRANRAFNPGQGSNRGKPGKSSGPPRKPKPTGNAKDAGKGPQPSDSRSGNSQSKRKANTTPSGAHSNTSQTHSNKSFKIPKKSYSAAAGASGSSSSNTATSGTPTAAADVEIGDLSLEEEASLHAESFKGIDHISVYIHTSRDRRLKITRDQFNYVWKTLQDLIFTALEAGQEIPPPVVLYFGEKGGRGVINCGDRTTAETVKRLVPNIVGPDGTTFNAWYRGETGDTLVTVIIEDKGLLEDHRIEPMLRLSNGLKHDDLSGFKVHKFPNTNLRKVTFGAHGETLERLKTIKSTRGKLNLGFLCCRMVISGQNQQQQGPQVVQNPPQGNALVMPAGPLPAIAAPAIAEPMEGVEHQNPPQPQPGSVPPQGPGPAPERGADNTGAPQADQAAEQAARLAKEAASIFKSLIK